jgi:hypothetical protein
MGRVGYYTRLCAMKPKMVKYLRGWINRVVQLWQETKE